MDKVNNIIEMNCYKKKVNYAINTVNEQDNDCEDWEADCELISKGDYAGLVKYREKVAKKNPSDFFSKYYLGEAYILNKEFEKAIDYLTPLHNKEPDEENIHILILDALFAMGKNENDFKWKVMPTVIELNEDIINLCYDLLKRKKIGRAIIDLYTSLLEKGYLKFSEKALFDAILNDRRFQVEKKSNIEQSSVKVAKRNNNFGV